MTHHQILYPKPQTVLVGRRPVLIRPVEFRHFEAFGQAAGAVLSMVATATPAELYRFAKDSGALLLIIRSCTNLGRWRVSRLPAAVALELMLCMVKVNSDFFDQALVKAAQQLGGAESPSA